LSSSRRIEKIDPHCPLAYRFIDSDAFVQQNEAIEDGKAQSPNLTASDWPRSFLHVTALSRFGLEQDFLMR
jgi:hypothetical protein